MKSEGGKVKADMAQVAAAAMTDEARAAPDLLRLACQIVSAYVSNNAISTDELPQVIQSVHNTLGALRQDGAASMLDEHIPAVPIKKSIGADYLVCLEDGKKLKMLKRYLRSQYGMTPDEYRAKWGLPMDYPMVAPNYAAQRSRLAKEIGLGRKDAAKSRRKK